MRCFLGILFDYSPAFRQGVRESVSLRVRGDYELIFSVLQCLQWQFNATEDTEIHRKVEGNIFVVFLRHSDEGRTDFVDKLPQTKIPNSNYPENVNKFHKKT